MSVVADVVVPRRTLDQRLEALKEANRIRTARSRVKGLLSEGVLELADVISNPMPELQSMKLIELVCAAPKLGRVKAARLLNITRISHHKTVGGLSSRQRQELVKALTVNHPAGAGKEF